MVILQLIVVAYMFQQSGEIIRKHTNHRFSGGDSQNPSTLTNALATQTDDAPYPSFTDTRPNFREFLLSGFSIACICISVMTFILTIYFSTDFHTRIIVVLLLVLDVICFCIQCFWLVNNMIDRKATKSTQKGMLFLIGHICILLSVGAFVTRLFMPNTASFSFVALHVFAILSLVIFSYVVGFDRNIDELMFALKVVCVFLRFVWCFS